LPHSLDSRFLLSHPPAPVRILKSEYVMNELNGITPPSSQTTPNVCFREQSGKQMLALRLSGFDPTEALARVSPAFRV
jgi:hypothetical protein